MTTLIDRRYRLRVNQTVVTELDIDFNVMRTLAKDPNTAEIHVKNLSEDTRASIEQRASSNVSLEAGYKDGMSLIFNGDLRNANTVREGANIITTIQSGDGEKNNKKRRISKSYAPGTPIRQAISDLANALGVGLGNINRIPNVEFPRAGAVFPTGTVVDGNAADELELLLRSAGLEYSIQDGALQVVSRKQSLKGTAVVLSPSSGLLGGASVGSDGILKCRTLMIPDVFPGRKIQPKSIEVSEDIRNIQSRGKGRKHLEGFSGVFRAHTCEYVGDTTSDSDWTIEIQAQPLFREAA